MCPQFLRLNGLTRENRHHSISLLRDAIINSGGWITDFHLFSNAAICINFELPRRHAGKFYSTLKATGLRLSAESVTALEACRRVSEETGAEPVDETDLSGTLQVTFIHDDPDLRIEVPPIPGS